jgi:hypothetical protein
VLELVCQVTCKNLWSLDYQDPKCLYVIWKNDGFRILFRRSRLDWTRSCLT